MKKVKSKDRPLGVGLVSDAISGRIVCVDDQFPHVVFPKHTCRISREYVSSSRDRQERLQRMAMRDGSTRRLTVQYLGTDRNPDDRKTSVNERQGRFGSSGGII